MAQDKFPTTVAAGIKPRRGYTAEEHGQKLHRYWAHA
jgi:hypothetical protein